MNPTVGIGTIASLLVVAAVATASPPAFEIRTEITSPTGEDLGRPRIKTILNREATLEYMRAGQILRRTFLIDAGCHPVSLRLERSVGDEPKKVTGATVIACEAETVDFVGKALGAPSMKTVLERCGIESRDVLATGSRSRTFGRPEKRVIVALSTRRPACHGPTWCVSPGNRRLPATATETTLRRMKLHQIMSLQSWML